MNISSATAEELLDLLSELSSYFDDILYEYEDDTDRIKPDKEYLFSVRIDQAVDYLEREAEVQRDPS